MGRRILLTGPPAAGKSSVAKHLLAAFPTCTYLDLDDIIRVISVEAGHPTRLADQQIDEAVRRLCEHAPPDNFIMELPHHDYVQLVEKGMIDIDSFDCIAILVCEYEVLVAREKSRAHAIPLGYIARCVGASEALSCYLEGKSNSWLRVDTRCARPEVVANCLVDFIRKDVSASLAKITVTPNPSRGHLGGHFKEAVEWDAHLVRSLIRRWSIDTALDIGCGNGGTIAKFSDLGIRAWGIDGFLPVTTRSSRVLAADLTQQWVEWPVKVDLVWCVEVLEHVVQDREENVVRSIVANAGKLVFITAAPPGQAGYHHVNCQPKSYWIDRFCGAGLGYVQDTPAILDTLNDEGPFGMNVFKRNGILFEVVR